MNIFTKEEIEHFHREGFITIRGIADSKLIEEMDHVVEESAAQRIPPVEYESELGYPGAPVSLDAPGGKTLRRLKQALVRHPIFLRWATHPGVIARLKQLLGPELVLPMAHHNCIMIKDPRFSSDTEWHQDIRYWNYQRPELIIVLLGLNRATTENGCLKFIPGSHQMEISDDCFDEEKFLRRDRPLNQDLFEKAKNIEMEPGDVLFFHCKTFHSANRNRSRLARKSVIFTYRNFHNSPIPDTRSASLPELLI